MKKTSLLLTLGSSLFLLPLSGFAQKKAAPAVAPVIAATAAANSFGLMERLTADTDMVIAFHNIDKHTKALSSSMFWKKIVALSGDAFSKGAPMDPAVMAVVQNLFGKEVTLSFGKGAAAQFVALKKLLNLVNVAQYEALLGGSMDATGGAGGNPFGTIFQSPESRAELNKLLQSIEMPPLMIQCKVDKAQEFLAKLIPLDKMKADAKEKVSITTTPIGGGTFTTIKVKLSDVIPPDADKQSPEMKPLFDELRKKTVDFTYGAIADDVAVFSMGKDHAHLAFADNAAGSVVASPDFATVATPLAGKNLALSMFATKEFIEGTWDDQPFQSIIKGIFNALKKNKTFAPMAAKVEPELAKLAAAEKAVFKMTPSNLASVAFWDKGLNIESRGGSDMRPLLADKPLSFDHLISGADVLYGINAQGNPEFSNDVRNYFEAWMSFIYSGAKAYMTSPLVEPEMKQQWTAMDMILTPALVEIYNGSKTVYQKGLGNETAVIADVKGKMPQMGEATADAPKGMSIPRISYLHDVANRAAIGQGWEQIVPGIEKLLVMAPPDENGKPMAIPPVQSKKTGAFTSYFFALPFGSPDVLPTATVGDKYFALGTSQALNDLLLGQTGKSTGKNSGAVGYFNVKVLRDALKPVADMQAQAAKAHEDDIPTAVDEEDVVDTTKPNAVLPKNTKPKKVGEADDAAVAEEKEIVPDDVPAPIPAFSLRDFVDLLGAFEKGRIKVWKEGDVWRDSTQIEIHDIK